MLTRRHLLRGLAAAPWLANAQQVVPGLRIVRGAVNTALVERNGRTLPIDSGDIAGSPAEWAIFTHHHPDQASGAGRLAASGTKIGVPAEERVYFEDPQSVWDAADKRLDHDYNCRPDLITLREPIPVTAAWRDGDAHHWQGLEFVVLATPGAAIVDFPFVGQS